MVKHVTRDYTYHSPWQMVVQAYQSRFKEVPNDLIPSLVKVEFTEERCCPETKEIFWCSEGWVEPPVPGWMSSLAGIPTIRFMSETVVNYETMTMICRIHNLDLRDRLTINETVSTLVHPDNPHWTLYRQESSLEINIPLFASTAEDICVKSYAKSYDQCRKVDEQFIAQLADSDWRNSYGFVEENIFKEQNIPKEHREVFRCPANIGIEEARRHYSLRFGDSSTTSKEEERDEYGSNSSTTLDSGSSCFSDNSSTKRKDSGPSLLEQCFPRKVPEEKELNDFQLSPKSGQDTPKSDDGFHTGETSRRGMLGDTKTTQITVAGSNNVGGDFDELS